MSVVPFTIEFVVVFFATCYVLHQYGNLKKQHWIVTLAVLISWFFSFLIIFILPLDVSSTCYQECQKLHPDKTHRIVKINATSNLTIVNQSVIIPGQKCEKPWSFMPEYVLPDMWKTVYWSSQLLSWFVLPMMQSYVYAGEFTVLGKIKRALYENSLWYGSYLVIFGILLIYVAVRPELDLDGNNLRIIGITASNTWGLLLLVLLLGYGLVELPRNAWNASLPGHRLSQTYFKISKLSTEKEEAEEQLEEVLQDVKKASEEVKYTSGLRQHIEKIISKCPEGSLDMFSKGTDDYVDYNDAREGKSSPMIVTEKYLVKLHRKVIVITQRAHRTQVQWNSLLHKAFELEDVEKNRDSRERIYKVSFSEHQTKAKSLSVLRAMWYWKITVQPLLFKALGVLLLCLSVSLVWSELTFFSIDPTLSFFAILVGVAKEGYLYFYIELICCFTIFYMCACTYYTVFKMRFFNYYYFAPKHQTDANSLLFSGLLLCRLTYALSLNFLALIHLDGHVTGNAEVVETSFTRFMGHMDVLSFVAKGFNVYYPMTVLLVCFCTYFNLGSRLLHCLGFQQFITDDDLSTDCVNEGRDIVRRERRRIQRAINGDKDWSQRATEIRSKFSSRREDRRRIDDEDDDDESILAANSRTRLAQSKGKKYSKLPEDSDRVQLLDSVEYEPADPPGSSLFPNSTTTAAPSRNIFDDV